MPPDKLTLASNTAGEHEPQPSPDVRIVAAERIKPYAIMAPLVLKALPECGSPPMGAVEIADAIVYGSRSTVRMLLANMVRLGLAIAEEVPARRGGFKKVYTRGPALVPDNFESAKLVYGDGET